jgi:peptidyl-prolyl cis-trans isomerase B (cyclophilin B)
VSTNQQRREAAKRKLERQQQRRVRREVRRKRTTQIVAAIVAIVVVAGLGLLSIGAGGSGSRQDSAAGPTTAPAGPCSFPATPGEPASRPVSAPTDSNPPRQGSVAATVTTNQGVLPVTLDRAKAPCTVESFVHLAQAGFFTNTPCHRLVTEGSLKVLQCGDPTGSGMGGPGYSVPDEPPSGLRPGPGGASIYPAGTLAMAKGNAPNSGGSQFFLVYADSMLPPEYTIFGTVAPQGLQVLQKVAAAGDDGSMDETAGGGKPKLPTTITSVAVGAQSS